MNVVILSIFFLSSALYPFWKLCEAGDPLTDPVHPLHPYGSVDPVCSLCASSYNPLIGTIDQIKRG